MNWVIICSQKQRKKVNVFIHSSGGYYMPALSRLYARDLGEFKQASGMSLTEKKIQPLYEDFSTLRNIAIPPSC